MTDATQPLHVVMLTSSYPQNVDDNASVFLRHLANGLQRRGLAVHVIAPAAAVPGTVIENGIFVYRFRYFPKRWQGLAYGSGILSNLKQNFALWIQVPFFLIAMTCTLIRVLHRVPRPCIVHAHWVLPQGVIAVFAKLLYGIPLVVSAHGADAFAMRSGPLRWMKQLCLRRCDTWTSNTRATSEAFASTAKLQASQIIPMGVHFDEFASGCRERLRAKLGTDSHIVLFVGRLVEKKGVDDLIRAFAALPDSLRARTQLWIVGDGHMMSSLKELATGLSVRDRIEFFGSVPNYLLHDYYAAADLFVGPSVVVESGDTEGQGVVFLEAFAARLCVIATRIGGIKDVIEDNETGYLVEPRSPDQLAHAITKLLHDAPLRAALANNAHRKAKRVYDWREIVPRFELLYRDLATRQHSN